MCNLCVTKREYTKLNRREILFLLSNLIAKLLMRLNKLFNERKMCCIVWEKSNEYVFSEIELKLRFFGHIQCKCQLLSMLLGKQCIETYWAISSEYVLSEIEAKLCFLEGGLCCTMKEYFVDK